MPECLIFDLFGTLVEYEAGRSSQDFSHCFKLAAEYGCRADYAEFTSAWDSAFQTLESEAAAATTEFHMNDVCELVVEAIGIQAPFEARELLVSSYIEDWSALITPVPGVSGLLKRLSQHYRLALISNTHYPPMVHRLLDGMSLSGVFEQVTLSVEVGRAKPHPRIFELTLERLGLRAHQTIYIGDSYEHDYKGATGVGMDCYLIGKHARVPRDHQLRSILDLAIRFDTSRK